MSKKRKRARNHRGMQAVTLCISTTMVLVLLGMVVFFVLSARNLSAHMKENLTVTVMLKDSVTVNDAHLLCLEVCSESTYQKQLPNLPLQFLYAYYSSLRVQLGYKDLLNLVAFSW